MSTRGQAWYLDFVIAILVFSTCLILFFKFVPNMHAEERIDQVYLDAKTLADTIVSTGHPQNWTNKTVIRIGIAEDSKIDHDKLVEYYIMNKNNYSTTKEIFRIRSDYAVFFTDAHDKPVNLSMVDIIGHPDAKQKYDGLDISGIQHSDVVGLVRVLTYNKTIVKMVIYAWA